MSLDLYQISEIAKEVTKDYNPRDLPSLEDISWAFPIKDRDRVYYVREGYISRIPNTQEGNALRELMTFRNFHNVLSYLSEGKTVGRSCSIPHHTGPCGDAEDGAYMFYPYLKQRNSELGKDKPNEGYFWKTIPSELVITILKVERIGRGKIVDENGEEIKKVGNNAYVDQELTKQYLLNMKKASEIGIEYFYQVLKSREQSKNYPQLVLDDNIERWDENTEFQLGYWENNEPQFLFGRGIKDCDEANKTLLCHYPEWAGGDGNEFEINASIDLLKKLGKKSLWRLVIPQNK